MNIGRRALRGDNEQGIRQDRAQATLVWGGQQFLDAGTQPAGTTLFFPFPVPAFQLPLATFDQLVDMRFERPTTWNISLFVEILQTTAGIAVGDSVRILWDVNVQVGKAKNRLQVETVFTQAAVPIAPAAHSTLVNLQLPAQTIQIIPNAMSVHWAAAQRIQTRWSAWIAPQVD
jgi:hypothetical protein